MTALPIGTRVRVVALGDAWASQAREAFSGQVGEVIGVESDHWNGRETVPLPESVHLVKFSAQVVLYDYPRTVWRFSRGELEVLS